MRILYPRCLFFPRFIHATLYAFLLFFFFFFAILAVLDGGSRRLGTTKGGCHYFVTPHDLHTDLEFEDIVLSVLDRLYLVPCFIFSLLWSCTVSLLKGQGETVDIWRIKGKLRENKETKKLNSHDPYLEDEVKLVLYP